VIAMYRIIRNILYSLTGKRITWKDAVKRVSFDEWKKAAMKTGIHQIAKHIKGK
jgi:hypothetical protein